MFHRVHIEAVSEGPVFSSISVKHASCQPYIMLFEAWSSAPASVETACLPAGCGSGQIKSLIHEGGWEEEGGNGKVEQTERREEREKKDMGGERREEERRGRQRRDEGMSEGEGRKKQEERREERRIKMTPLTGCTQVPGSMCI